MKKLLYLSLTLLFVFSVACTTTGGGASDEEPLIIELEAKDAELITDAQLVFEEGPDRNNVGWWTNTDDEIKWSVEITQKGTYTVLAKVACDPQFPGSEVGVTINEQTFKFEVPDTGDWASYTTIECGKIDLDPGTYDVSVKAISVASRFVANLQSIKLMK